MRKALSNFWKQATSPRVTAASAQPGKLTDPVDAYWHERYLLAPHFVSGRGYDQYRPAYALGWRAALDAGNATQDFDAVEPQLQDHWERAGHTSLLHWSQVRDAVHASWLQAREPVAPAVVASSLSLHSSAVLNAVLALGRQAHMRLGHCMSPMPQGLTGQVLARHFNTSQMLVDDLERAIVSSGGVALPARAGHAAVLRSNLLEGLLGRQEGPDYALEQAQECQEQWLNAYEAAEKTKLPKPLSQTLHRQALMLRGHLEAIHWLRRYMP